MNLKLLVKFALSLNLAFVAASLWSCSKTNEAKHGRLTQSEPVNGAVAVPVDTDIILTFSEQLDTSNLEVLSEGNSCHEDHALQLSADDFSSCVAITVDVVESSSYRKLAVQPIERLEAEQTYQLRLTSKIAFRHFDSLIGTLLKFTTATTEED